MHCNCYPRSSQSTCCVCGGFPEPTVHDEGKCFPYRVKRDCEAPVIPQTPCPGEIYETIYQPEDPINPFKVSANLKDENCENITDQNDNPILTYIT